MTKKTESSEIQQPKVESEIPAYMEELQKNGTTVITAPTIDELAEQVNNIPTEVRYAAGAVGRNIDTNLYTLRITLISINNGNT